MRDKLNNLVLFDKATYDKLYKEVPNYKLITPAVVSERLKIRGSLARNALQELLAKGEPHLFRSMPEMVHVGSNKRTVSFVCRGLSLGSSLDREVREVKVRCTG